VSFDGNSARGGRGGNGSPGNGDGGLGAGGGLYVAAGEVRLTDVSLSANTTRGGNGGSGNGGDGGNGLGGGLYAAGGAVSLFDSSATGNSAQGGTGGPTGPPPPQPGPSGEGIGGGLFIESDSLVGLNAYTASHVSNNTASTSDPNISGSYRIIPLPGDYNNDGRVDAGDYVRWRNHLGDSDESALNNNGDGGGVTPTDYTWWKQHYGTSGSGGLASFRRAGIPGPGYTSTIPEPATAFLALLALACSLAASRRRLPANY
jgi:hypothetical protein